ncbi:MAG: bifunctional DNA primase/helicase [Rhodocyclaceae bacterium]|nr:bifunctional DNA primase/helicase [Rhodocyclaceae bacterium]
MQADLHREILTRLNRDYGFKANAGWLRQGKCPSCGKKELFTHADHPWVLRCGRANKCGVEYHVKDVYADLFASWGDRFPATPEAPNAAADAYLRDARGFSLSRIAGWYVQENFYKQELKIGSATVRFALAKDVWWERIIDRPERFGSQKANFRGAYKGMWWQPPSLGEIGEELWIAEGIFDAIALLHHEIPAVSAMSCNNYPEKALAALAEQCRAAGRKRPRLVWAFDAGRAGRGYARRFCLKSREEGWEVVAAIIPQRPGEELDWNDMHQRGRLESKDIADYLYHGALLMAETPAEKALLIYKKKGWSSFDFEFDSQLWWFKLDIEAYNKARQAAEDETKTEDERRDEALKNSGVVSKIANCHPTALYYQANLLTDESWYYFRIDFPHDGKPVKNTFTAAQLASSAEFKKRLLAVAAGSIYTGTSGQLDFMLERWLSRIKTVQTIDFVGYSKEHEAYVYNEVAIKGGRVYELNDEDFFDVGRLAVKSLSQSVGLAINTDLKDFQADWINLLWTCYHAQGVVALAFWLGTLFAEQIRAHAKSFPFLEVVGEPGSGKSTLIEFLWKLLGRRDYEGFDPVKSTIAARSRNFAQVSNMPVVLIEGDRGSEDNVKQRGFDWDEMKPLYNGRSVYSRGVKNGGNETYEPPFRGAIVISQNAPVSASDAMLQRIVHMHFSLASHTPEGKAAGDVLQQVDMETVSGFLLKAAKAEAEILAVFGEAAPRHEQRLLGLKDIKNLRIVKNHAQVMALVDALAKVVPISADMKAQALSELEDMAIERQQAINKDHPLVQEFWEIFDYLDGTSEGEADHDGALCQLNHSRDPQLIAISLNHFVQMAADKRQQIPPITELKRVLKTSRERKFLDLRPVNSAIHARYNERRGINQPPKAGTVKCWVFEAPKNPRREASRQNPET